MSELKSTPAPVAPVDYAAIAKDMPSDAGDAGDAEFNEAAAAGKPAPVAAKPTEEAPAEGEPAAAPEPEDEKVGVGTPFEKGFAQLTKRNAALRAREDAIKPFEGLAKAVNPIQAAALSKALASGSPMAAMNALGFSYADIAASVAGGGAKPPAAAPPTAPAAAPAAKDEDPEIAAIKASFRAQQVQQQQATILGGIKDVVTKAGEKFKTIAGLEDFAGVDAVLAEMWNGSHPDPAMRAFPSDNGLENIAIAAEEYERRLVSGEVPLTKKQWEKLASLTGASASAPTASEATRERPGNAPVSSAGKTLTNKTGAPRAPAATRTDPSKLYEEIARQLK